LKLIEIKIAFIDKFFQDTVSGVHEDLMGSIFESMGKKINLNQSMTKIEELMERAHHSQDPSKAFNQFTKGRIALMAIMEDAGVHNNAIFLAARMGNTVYITDTTKIPFVEKLSDLTLIKSVLQQAKSLNDDIFFNISTIKRLI